MAYTLTPSDSLLTPKDGSEVRETDSKYTTQAYTAVADDAYYHLILPVIDCRNLWNFCVAMTNNSTAAISIGCQVIALEAPGADWSDGFDGIYTGLVLTTIMYGGVSTLAPGVSGMAYSKLGPLPPYIAVVGQSDESDLNLTAQLIGTYL